MFLGGDVAQLVACPTKDLEVGGSNFSTYYTNVSLEFYLFELPTDGNMFHVGSVLQNHSDYECD
jgi:hypothetical protein